MTVLRQKMIEDMQLRGLAERTQEAYLLAVSQLARHYHKSPDRIDEEELRQYFLFLKNEKHAARASCTIALCGIKFFFERTLNREWKTFEFLRPAKEKKLPRSFQEELLDYVEYLVMKAEQQEKQDWTSLSLSSAIRDMEDEATLYSPADIRVGFS